MRKWKIITWIISFLSSYLLFVVMEKGTADPSSLHGNGNPFLLLLLFFYPILLCFYYLSVDLVVRILMKKNNKKLNAATILMSSVLTGVLYFLIRWNAKEVMHALVQSNNAAYSDGLNQFTNSVYFNTYTFLLTLLLCVLLGAVISTIFVNKK